ncbi:MAG: GxxExxY protein [Planctomycetota bacterium]
MTLRDDWEGDGTSAVIGAAMRVHDALGPGLLESAYKACLVHELTLMRVAVRSEVPIPIRYRGVSVECGYRADLVVEGRILIELKTVARLQPIHGSQLLTYLRLSGISVGLLVNFNVRRLKNGIRRVRNFAA